MSALWQQYFHVDLADFYLETRNHALIQICFLLINLQSQSPQSHYQKQIEFPY